MNPVRASLKSQLGESPCEAADTIDMFILRGSDDLQSKRSLGNALAAQYRFREAVQAYADAMQMSPKDWKLLSCWSGAKLTLRQFEEAMQGYL